jgi:hypothetical protein
MQVRYDEDFVEQVAFLFAYGAAPQAPRLQVTRFHRERERLYAVLDPAERNAAFFRLHLEWFREWGLEQALLGVLREFALLPEALTALAVRKARLKSDEGAELYVSSENGRVGVLAMRVERFHDRIELARFLRHELTHLQDMIDPSFGYSPDWQLPGQNAAQQRLMRERYRLLWDITVDGRLARAPEAELEIGQRHRNAFDRAFGFWPEARRNESFERLWNESRPRHAELMAMASDPREIKTHPEIRPGAPCPLCGFSTFTWAEPGACEKATAKIRAEFPQWTPDQGACRRCVEVYRHAGAHTLATI